MGGSGGASPGGGSLLPSFRVAASITRCVAASIPCGVTASVTGRITGSAAGSVAGGAAGVVSTYVSRAGGAF